VPGNTLDSSLFHTLHSLTSIKLNIYLNGKSPCCNSTFTILLLAKNV